MLQKTEEIAKARQNVSELLMSQVSEVMKQQKRIKEQNFKRVRAFIGSSNLGMADRGWFQDWFIQSWDG